MYTKDWRLNMADYISSYYNSIYKMSSTQVRGYVKTTTYNNVSSIEYTMYFQKEVSGNWSTISTKSGVVYSTDNQVAYEYLTVSSGYNYRIRTIHTVRENSNVESRTLLSSVIYV